MCPYSFTLRMEKIICIFTPLQFNYLAHNRGPVVHFRERSTAGTDCPPTPCNVEMCPLLPTLTGGGGEGQIVPLSTLNRAWVRGFKEVECLDKQTYSECYYITML